MRKVLFYIFILFSKLSLAQINCNNWLATPSTPSYVQVGQLNVTGNQITVEATINRTTPYIGGTLYAGDIVSKHATPSDANYLLRPNEAEITTDNGYFRTPDICEIELNKTYHVAMVYDGNTLKFYRNGFLMSQVAATGNLYQNLWNTRIGYYEYQLFNTNFIGYINEVRIWNVARTQSEIRAYMGNSLPNPTTQPGLLAYYTFDDLMNKQGNPSWNGTLGGSATINSTNPNCTFIADSCSIPVNVPTIINDYTEVLGYDICKNELKVADATKYNPGDTVLIIQMKGAVIDSNNTATFGNITNYNNSGNYEMNIVKQKNGNSLTLLNVLQRQYDIPYGKVQLVRVPYYNNVTINSTLTCLPWDGSKGGVLVLNVANTTTLNANIDVSGKGFHGGRSPNPNTTTLYCDYNDYYYPKGTAAAADKGESITSIGDPIAWGKGSPANGGGGGNGHNSGGGGGSNGGAGGFGGYQLDACGGSLTDNRGIGGKPLAYNTAVNKIFMGGGGGSGHTDNAGGSDMNGGNGGGIIIIKSPIINSGGFKIIAKGGDAPQCNLIPIALCHDASGGGGAAGTVLIENSTIVQPTTVDIRGGKGGDLVIYNPPGASKIGPGAGGGAGVVWLNSASLPLNIVVNNTGGINGVIVPNGNDPYGTTPGADGINLFNLKIPVDVVLFKPNIDSVRIKDSATSCNSFNFKGAGYTNTSSITTWQWFFGDGGIANTQNTAHTYSTTGNFTAKLIVTDVNGCRDSITFSQIVTCIATTQIINDYTPVLGFDICKNELRVADASKYNPGDTVLLIQMKGAIIDSSNTSNFGTVLNYKNAGNYEYNYVKQKTGNVIQLKNLVTRQYDIPTGKVQLVRVPYYDNLTINSKLTCLPWDGSIGGVLAFNVKNTLTMNTDIDVSGKGFIGGQVINPRNNSFYCHENDYYYPNDPIKAAPKGEGIAILSDQKIFGKGALSNGGGGGLEHNSGGGGGSNITNGGLGGKEWIVCGPPIDNNGIGGKPLAYSNITNKIFLGGGGGAGHCDNLPGFNPLGGNGGGIIIIKSTSIRTNNNLITADGAGGVECFRDAQAYKCHEGMGGGGGGGTILIDANNFLDNTNIHINGGKGADMNGEIQGQLGPGGGGGGGVCWLSNTTLPVNTFVTQNGGINGINIDFGNDPYGSTPGQDGSNLFNLKIPVDTVLFKPNIDSVRIKDSATSCAGFDFKGFGYTNTSAINSWKWSFGDGGTDVVQNTSHTYISSGTYTVKLIITDINGCIDSITRDVSTNATSFDFSYTQDVCNPLSVQFFNIGADSTNPYWSFGDGNIITGTLSPVHTYASPGNYIVKFSVQNGSCIDTVTKTISLSIIPADIIITPDTTICINSAKQLRTVPSLNFCWSPITYLDNPLSPNPVTSTPQNITYYFTAQVTGNNVINNGDFNNGNAGFTSGYSYANPNITEAQYFVGKSPQAWNASMSNCADHTTGNGNMMLVNGAPIPDINVWKQTVTVTPNTNYAFSIWIQALYPPNPAQLSFSINGSDIGTLITASLPTCTWTQFFTTWNSGNNTSATISIVNKNTFVQGNDFALDDISFAPVLVKRDSVKISVNVPFIKSNNDSTVCSGSKIQLQTSGANTYSWTPSTGLSNPLIPNPVATVSNTIVYFVSGVNNFGCTAKDTLNLTALPLPAIIKSNDTAICNNTSVQIFASGGNIYSWSPAATLSNPNIANPVASPSSTTKYFVTVTGNNSCSNTDSVLVKINPIPVFAVSSGSSVCSKSSEQLAASGGDTYIWSPSDGLDNPDISNPIATPDTSITYTVTIHENTCNTTGTLSTNVTVLPLPGVNATSSNDLTCSLGSSQLNATGAVNYTWSPPTGLNNSNIASPVAAPLNTTLYKVIGKDINGCTNSDTVTVKADFNMKALYLLPNSFTPNGDGLNDCFGIKYWGVVQNLDFRIYNRFGEMVFHTNDPSICWDGTYKQKLQDVNVFVYIITAQTACGIVSRKGTVSLLK